MDERLRVWAPGRVNLIGEHTDTTDGLVLPAAIDRGVSLEADVGGGRIVLASAEAVDRVDVVADGSRAPRAGWGRLVAAVAAELALLDRPPVGLRGRLSSDLPQGAGLGSSAALEVAIATALLAAAGHELPALAVAAACRRAEHRATGVPTGIMDQAASLLGRAGHAVMLDCGTLEHRQVPLPAGLALLILDSGVHHDLRASAYGLRVRELSAALPALGGRRPADVEPNELGPILAGLDDLPARRLRHAVTENQRVREAEKALRIGDLPALERLFADSQASLRDDFEVTSPELDTLVELALDAGAVAARMTGAGFGGAVLALVPADRVGGAANAVLTGFARRHPRVHPSAFTCRAADGAGVIRSPASSKPPARRQTADGADHQTRDPLSRNG